MSNKKITELSAGSTPTGAELMEAVQGGQNVILTVQQVGSTREFNRTFSETLVFDKNEIFHLPFTLTGDLNLVIGTGGLVDQSSSMRFRFTTDGTHAIFFGPGFDFLYPPGLVSGTIPEAGTYEMYLLYTNGSVVVNLPGSSSQSSGLVQLLAPANFVAVADGENALDLSWDDVANETGYQIEKSLTGTSGWVLFSNPAADATSDTETGLNPGDTVFYRIKALGDGVNFSDSPYSVASGTTASSGDVTAPIPTFLPANGNSVWPVNQPATITFDEDIIDADGVTVITSANAANYVTLKQTNSGGADIAKTVTYDSLTRKLTVTPTTIFGANQLVYLAVHDVEDVNGNEMALQSITFTTTAYTLFNGTSNRLIFGDILDALLAANDTIFRMRITVNNPSVVGTRTYFAKWSTSDNQRALIIYSSGADMKAIINFTTGTSTNNIIMTWANVLGAGEQTLEFRYDGSVDTGSGLNRLVLLKDAVVQSKVLDVGATLPASIFNGTAQLSFGVGVGAAGAPHGASFFLGEAKDFVIENASLVEELNVPVLRTGLDTSGNARNGTWVEPSN